MALIQGEDSLMPHLLVELIETSPHKFPRPAGSSNEMLRQDALDVLWVNALIDFVPRLSAGRSGTLTHVDPHVKRLLQSYARKLHALSFVCIWCFCERSVICDDGRLRVWSCVLCATPVAGSLVPFDPLCPYCRCGILMISWGARHQTRDVAALP